MQIWQIEHARMRAFALMDTWPAFYLLYSGDSQLYAVLSLELRTGRQSEGPIPDNVAKYDVAQAPEEMPFSSGTGSQSVPAGQSVSHVTEIHFLYLALDYRPCSAENSSGFHEFRWPPPDRLPFAISVIHT